MIDTAVAAEKRRPAITLAREAWLQLVAGDFGDRSSKECVWIEALSKAILEYFLIALPKWAQENSSADGEGASNE